MASLADLTKDFERLVKNNRLSHGYIFFGPSLPAAQKFARMLAGFLERHAWEDGSMQVDASVLLPEAAGDIAAARSITHFLWQKPVVSPRRTLIVMRADALNPLAQNAILKIAEEPPEHALLLLVAYDWQSLIAPLASRFQKIYFNIPAEDGGTEEPAYARAREVAEAILAAGSARERSQILKDAFAEEVLADALVYHLCKRLMRKPLVNAAVLRELLHRHALMRQYPTNKKLQLEAALSKL